jgi:hypothetical protein
MKSESSRAPGRAFGLVVGDGQNLESSGMHGTIEEILQRLPPEQHLNKEICEFFDKEIRKGSELNQVQKQGVLDMVQFCMQHDMQLPPPFESLWAFVYLEWTEEAKTSEEAKKNLAILVQRLKANPATANLVAQTAQRIQKEREVRRQEMARLAAVAESKSASPLASKRGALDPPNVYIAKMQAARLGVGENPMVNLELAAQLAEDAVDAYPSSPKLLFEAAGCHQLLAQKGTQHSTMDRYVHLKEAHSLYQRCLTILSNQPYATLKGEYDQWRKGLAELLVKVQKELEILEQQQR